jgi:uncharacterized protein YkwD
LIAWEIVAKDSGCEFGKNVMKISVLIAAVSIVALGACEPTNVVRIGADGKPLPPIYKVPSSGEVEFTVLDSVNLLRQSSGAAPLSLDSKLTAAAATHARDMAVQNRAWHFGSDGSSPLDRVARTGYNGILAGENISETYETELETLSAWMGTADSRRVILDPEAKDMGFSWYQEPSGKIWWAMVTGRNSFGSINYTFAEN